MRSWSDLPDLTLNDLCKSRSSSVIMLNYAFRPAAILIPVECLHIKFKNLSSYLVVASNEIWLEADADKTKYMVMSRNQNERRSHNIRIYNSSFERVEEFRFFGTALKKQISIQEEIKSRLKARNACYYSVHNLLSSRLLSKNMNIRYT